jgi:hypothetical protein
MPNSIASLLGSLSFWTGVGRGIVDLALVYAMYLVVMTVLGHPKPWKRRSGAASSDTHGSSQSTETDGAGDRRLGARAAASARHELHLEILDNLKQSRQLQGATIVLVVFAVVILAINGVLAGSETATILAGITGYVLGARTHPQDHQPNGTIGEAPESEDSSRDGREPSSAKSAGSASQER